MNYGDAVGEGLREASAKVAAKAIPNNGMKRHVAGSNRIETLGWETGIEPATVGATVRCSAS